MSMDLGNILSKTLAGASMGGGAGYLYTGDREGATKGAEIGAVGGLLYGLYEEATKPEPGPALPPHYDSSYVYDPNRPNQAPTSYSTSVARIGLQYMQQPGFTLQQSILAGFDALNRIAQSPDPNAQQAASYAMNLARSARSAEEQHQIILTTLQSLAGNP